MHRLPPSSQRAGPARPCCVSVAPAASTAITGFALYSTYQPDRQQTFTSTGVLGTLQRNQGILSDVETRASQVAPYLRNLIALSTALQQAIQESLLGQSTPEDALKSAADNSGL